MAPAPAGQGCVSGTRQLSSRVLGHGGKTVAVVGEETDYVACPRCWEEVGARGTRLQQWAQVVPTYLRYPNSAVLAGAGRQADFQIR